MNFEQLKDKFIYSKFSKLNPFNPLLIWWDTTNDLDEFYKRPDVNLSDNTADLVKKNDMRHIRFHDLRHTCASLLLKNGVPMKQIQDSSVTRISVQRQTSMLIWISTPNLIRLRQWLWVWVVLWRRYHKRNCKVSLHSSLFRNLCML